MTKPKPKVRRGPKAGSNSPVAYAQRCTAFVEAYLLNGHNASAAAAASGYTGHHLTKAGWRLLHAPETQRLLAERARQVALESGLNAKQWADELHAVAHSDVGDLFGPDEQLVSITKLPHHVRAGISALKVSPDGQAIEYKFWDKCAALQIMARHLGLFERDNVQTSDITVRVELVG